MTPVSLLDPKRVTFKQVGLAPDVSKILSRWWQDFAIANPLLFDGPMVGCKSSTFDNSTMTIEWYTTSYAHYLQRKTPVPVTEPARAVYCSVALLSRTSELVVGQMAEATSSPSRLQLPGGNITPPREGGLSITHCIVDACREVEEEVGLSLDRSTLSLWRVKIGGVNDDVGLMFKCQLNITNEEIIDRFERHTRAMRSRDETPELDRLLLVRPAEPRLGASHCVDYLPAVALALADEGG